MRFGSRLMTLGATGIAMVWLLGVAVSGQAPGEKPLMAEDVFKNVTVMRGIPVNDFMLTMGIFSASLGMSCQDCHSADDRNWDGFAADNARKRTARRMIVLMNEINKTHFGGRQMVTCFSCHRGNDRPRTAAGILDVLYGTPPDSPLHVIQQAPTAPPAEQVLDRYIQALGGAQRVAALRSFVARGTAVGYGPESQNRPVDLYAEAPNRLTSIIHTESGDITTASDGRNVWLAAPFRPVAVLPLSGEDLEAARLDAMVAFPGRIKEALRNWRVGFPEAIGDRDANVVQGTTEGGTVVTLYFDVDTGLLARQMRHVASPVGPLVTRVDYADYREVAGVKVPYRWTQVRLNGREHIELAEVRPNVPIDAGKFARPVPPVAAPRTR